LSDIRQKLFSIQKFQILALYTSTSAEQRVTDSYVFAWLENIYPFLNDSACWHQAFEDCFAVGVAQIVGLLEQEGDQQAVALLIDVQSLEFEWTDDPWADRSNGYRTATTNGSGRKDRSRVVEDAVFGHHAALACHMANESYFQQQAVHWDEATKTIKT